uniref:NAD(P)-binding domain-containing protein n=1 Tax=Janibacter limosus TaxID=53458 RepID=A0AC61U2H1_9MICO|nr:NAD(P)-binding domain-containing protein [Janibacter limosus]
MRIAVVGCGEVGATYARTLVEAGAHELVLCDPEPGAALARWAAEHDVPLHADPGPRLAEVQRARVCVPGDLAHDVVRGLLDHLPAGAVVVDLTTAAPADKRRSVDAAAGRADYVDAVIMGAVGLTGAATPLLVAGPPVGLEGLEDLGAPVRHLPAAGAGTQRRSSCCAASSPRGSKPSVSSASSRPRSSGYVTSSPPSRRTSTRKA